MSKILGFTLVLLFAGTTAFAQSPSCSKKCTSKKTAQVTTDGEQTKMMTTNAGTSKKSCTATKTGFPPPPPCNASKKACTGKKTSNVSTDGKTTKMMTTNAGTQKKSCASTSKQCTKASGSTSATFKNAGVSPEVSTTSHSSEKHGKKCTMSYEECAKKMGMTVSECKAICGGKAGVKASASAEE